MSQSPLRIVTFNFAPEAYRAVRKWIIQGGHKHVLAVTTPGPLSRPTPSYTQIVEATPRDVDVLVTTRLKSVATPLIRELKPDLIFSFSFPYRIRPELCAIPTYGAVNLHPAVLPAYRGPNALRPFYEGAPIYGATAHWIAEEYDTGRILSQKGAAMPDMVTGETFAHWFELMDETISEGMARAIAGDAGTEQNHAEATYAAPFAEEEYWLDWHDPQRVIKRKADVLNMFAPGTAKARIADEAYQVQSIELMEHSTTNEEPGTLIEKSAEAIVIQVADGQVRLVTKPIEG